MVNWMLANSGKKWNNSFDEENRTVGCITEGLLVSIITPFKETD